MMLNTCMLSSCLVVRAQRSATLLVGFLEMDTSVTSSTGVHTGVGSKATHKTGVKRLSSYLQKAHDEGIQACNNMGHVPHQLNIDTLCMPIPSVCPYPLHAHTLCMPIPSACPHRARACHRKWGCFWGCFSLITWLKQPWLTSQIFVLKLLMSRQVVSPANDDVINHSNGIIEGALSLKPLPPLLLPHLLPLQYLQLAHTHMLRLHHTTPARYALLMLFVTVRTTRLLNSSIKTC